MYQERKYITATTSTGKNKETMTIQINKQTNKQTKTTHKLAYRQTRYTEIW